jgi:parvulin-like peptidyl-prolyl isomerase
VRTAQRRYPRFFLLAICLLLIRLGPAAAQTGGSAPQTAGAGKEQAQTGKNDPVLILHSQCAQQGNVNSAAKSCETVVTRAEFDSLIAALDPAMPDSNRLNLATEYARLLILGEEARRLKLDQQPQFKKLEEFTGLQLLERQLVRALGAEASTVSQDDMEQYYKQNAASYELGSLRRLFIPKTGSAGELTQAEAMQKRAAKGEDFDSLQGEIWSGQGRITDRPSTRIGPVRRPLVPAAQQKIFDLNPGDVSAVQSDDSGYTIYKLESKTAIPLETVEADIRGRLQSQRLQDRIRDLRAAVMISVNEDYFGDLPKTEELARHHGMEHQGSHLMPMSNSEKQHR